MNYFAHLGHYHAEAVAAGGTIDTIAVMVIIAILAVTGAVLLLRTIRSKRMATPTVKKSND